MHIIHSAGDLAAVSGGDAIECTIGLDGIDCTVDLGEVLDWFGEVYDYFDNFDWGFGERWY